MAMPWLPAQKGNPFSYPHSKQPFSREIFQKPTSEYRGIPVWSWTGRLDRDQILGQIEQFGAMGMGGFHIQARDGLDTEYLGPEFVDLVRQVVDQAQQKGMLVGLCDEERPPSGGGGGRVLRENPDLRSLHLLLTPRPYGQAHHGTPPTTSECTSGHPIRSEEGFLLARYNVLLNGDGTLGPETHLLAADELSTETTWYVYVEPNPSSPWFQGSTYVDTLSKKAVSRFLETTHDVYAEELGDKLGDAVATFLTDEPHFGKKTRLSNPFERTDVFLPWTMDLPKAFKEKYGSDLLPRLMEVVWDLPAKRPSAIRYRYHDFLCERFVDAYMDQVSSWCQSRGVYLVGHMKNEPFLWSQTEAVGEMMRCYRNLDMPGVDIANDRLEFNTVKQAVSVARQNGLSGVMSEVYGVTDWTFSFAGFKGQGDWQAALGVTLRVPRMTWSTMKGNAKRDYPASIGFQSPWYQEYNKMETYFSRINVAMTRGRPVTRIAVIHPVESHWLTRGPMSTNAVQLDYLEEGFKDLTEWLLFGLMDFDFVSESLLPDQQEPKGHSAWNMSGDVAGPWFTVGHCRYQVVIVPNLRTLRSTTLKALERLADNGGTIIFAGDIPHCVDGVEGVVAKKSISALIRQATHIPLSKHHVLRALAPVRDIMITDANGKAVTHFLYQMRADGGARYVFIANTERQNSDSTQPRVEISIRGHWKVELLDNFNGTISELPATITIHSAADGWTSIPYRFDGCSSLLFRLRPGFPTPHLSSVQFPAESYRVENEVALINTSLTEPNVLLLDFADFRLEGDHSWRRGEEILRIDNVVRERLGLPLQSAARPQPWTLDAQQRRPLTSLHLRLTFESELDIAAPLSLALEEVAELQELTLNGQPLNTSVLTGWWVDPAIQTIGVPPHLVRRGSNVLQLRMPFGPLTSLERVYLLGEGFGVRLAGRHAVLVAHPAPALLQFGDATRQGLPFYTGNITYHCTMTAPAGPAVRTAVTVPRFGGPVVSVTLKKNPTLAQAQATGSRKSPPAATVVRTGLIFCEPYIFEFGALEPGSYALDITAYGNRFNSFGHVHVPALPGKSPAWCGPGLWRTEEDWWTSEYKLCATGVLSAPRVLREGVPREKTWRERPVC